MVDKILNPVAAAGAYASTAKVAQAAPSINTSGEKPASFAELMKNSVVGSINVVRRGEEMTAKAITGEASLPDVVRAVNAVDATVQTVVAVRDKLVGAYTEIMRMQI